jgi:hypothetical protein
MTDREILHAIAARLQTLIMAAHDLDLFVNSLASEVERSATRIRELAGAPMQPTGGNGTALLKRRGRPPRDPQLTTPTVADAPPSNPDVAIRPGDEVS